MLVPPLPQVFSPPRLLRWAYRDPPFFVMEDTDGNPVGAVHGLAIVGEWRGGTVLRLSCGADWDALNDTDYDSEQEARTGPTTAFDIREVDWHPGEAPDGTRWPGLTEPAEIVSLWRSLHDGVITSAARRGDELDLVIDVGHLAKRAALGDGVHFILRFTQETMFLADHGVAGDRLATELRDADVHDATLFRTPSVVALELSVHSDEWTDDGPCCRSLFIRARGFDVALTNGAPFDLQAFQNLGNGFWDDFAARRTKR